MRQALFVSDHDASAGDAVRRGLLGKWRLRTARMRLSTRLMLVIATCLLPIIGLQVAIAWSQWVERKAQLSDLTIQQAQLLAGNLDGIAQGARILLGAAAESRQVRTLDPGCGQHLANLRRHAPGFAFIALVDPTGRIACASTAGLAESEGRAVWVQAALAAPGFAAGRYSRSAAYPDGVLPFNLPLETVEAAGGGTLVAALDLNWLEQALQRMKRAGSPFLVSGVLTVADADGTILARDTRQAEFAGKPFPPAAMALTRATVPGNLRLRSIDGTDRVVGYTPPTEANFRLSAVVGFHEPALMHDLEQALLRSALIVAGVALLALGLTLVVARRFVTQPTLALLEAARRWRRGDLAARAPNGCGKSEFGQLALAFNDMAASLQRREEELRDHAQALEARVAARTQELQQANIRLQAEIAERQNTQAALLQAQKLQAVGQLAGGIAHDFNNILQAVLGGVALIGRRASDAAEVHRLTAMVEDAARRGESITRRLLAFARREELRADRLDAAALLTGLREVLAATLGAGIQVEVDAAPGLPAVFADRGQLETVLVNLATNARDAMRQGGRLTLSAMPVRVGGADDGGEDNRGVLTSGTYVRITVADTGEGMSAATFARAGEPFFTTKPAGQGTGLGLAMAQSFAEGSGGRMTIESEPGCGTRVALWLPAAGEPACRTPKALRLAAPGLASPGLANAGLAAPGLATPSVAPPARPSQVLLVDDEPMVREVLAAQLADAGHDVAEAADGTAALALLDQGLDCDILVTDLAMPGLDGVALIRKAQQRRPGLPAILVTGYAGDVAGLAAGGAFTLLRKPVSGATLTERVDTLLGAARENAQAVVGEHTV